MSGEVDAVAVVVPAHDEEETIDACVRSIIAAARRSCRRLPVSVCVVADRCTDGTEHLAREAGGEFDRFVTVSRSRPRPLGAVRNFGSRCATALLPRVRAERLWLLHTDADSTVPVTWIDDHLRHAFGGADAVAGRADVQDYSAITVRAQHRYQEHVRRGEDRFTHSHVYGANLGVRADVFHAVGGFPEVLTSEDHGLWLRVVEAGAAVCQPNDVRVRTSGRTQGRAPGGLAALLRTLACEEAVSSRR